MNMYLEGRRWAYKCRRGGDVIPLRRRTVQRRWSPRPRGHAHQGTRSPEGLRPPGDTPAEGPRPPRDTPTGWATAAEGRALCKSWTTHWTGPGIDAGVRRRGQGLTRWTGIDASEGPRRSEELHPPEEDLELHLGFGGIFASKTDARNGGDEKQRRRREEMRSGLPRLSMGDGIQHRCVETQISHLTWPNSCTRGPVARLCGNADFLRSWRAWFCRAHERSCRWAN
jgi:hypothetical protein